MSAERTRGWTLHTSPERRPEAPERSQEFRRLAIAGEGRPQARATRLSDEVWRLLTADDEGECDLPEAEALARQAVGILHQGARRGSAELSMACWLLGRVLWGRKQPWAAIPWLLEALSIGDQIHWRPGCPCDDLIHFDLAGCARETGDDALHTWVSQRLQGRAKCSCFKQSMWVSAQREASGL